MGGRSSSVEKASDDKKETTTTVDTKDKVADVIELPDSFEGPLDKQYETHQLTVKKKKLCACLPDSPPSKPTVPITKILYLLPGRRYRVYMLLGTLFAAAQGVVFPAFSVVFGQLFNIFYTQTPSQIKESAGIIAAVFVGIALYNLVTGYLGQMLWGLVGEAVGNFYRREFFNSVLRQEAGYFQVATTGALTSMLNKNVEDLRAATGTKIAMWLMFLTQAVAGVIVAFVYSWKLTLVLLAISPLMGIGSVLQMRVLAQGTQSQAGAFQSATSLAIEVISGFTTVAAFGWEEKAREKYFKLLEDTKRPREVGTHLAALAWGFSFFFIFAVYSIGFWYGAQLVADGIPPPGSVVGTVNPGGLAVGDMLIVFFAVIMGAMGLGQMFSLNPEFAAARAAAYEVLELLKRQPLVDPNPNGIKGVELEGDILFRNVRFTFPSRPTDEVLRGINLEVAPGTVVGVVGHSGAGKSTLIALLERFYDVPSGAIMVDGRNIKDYELAFLRSKIGLVSQEPVLFDCSIEENIRFGKSDATMEEVVEAAKMANAHNFIVGLPEGYNTRVGEGGCQLSGGQKQRVAIARATIKQPKILLLDEATSALDAESETLVQEALHKLMQGRTTIVVAHRLSTIRDADMIVVLDKGVIVEMGKHMELLLKRNHYYSLVARQMDPEDLKRVHLLAAEVDPAH